MSERLLSSQAHPKSPLGSKKRKRATNACLRCRLKKQRCDGISQPCGNCAKSSTECIFPDEIVGEKFLRQHIANLEVRIRELSSALKEINPDHPVLESNDSDNLNDQDLVDGFGFLSLTSGAEPLYVGGSSGASWGRIFSSALCNQTGEAHFFTESLIPPKTSLCPSRLDESLGTKLIFPYKRAAPSETGSNTLQSNFSMQLKPGFIYPPLPQDELLSDEIFATVFTTIQARHCFMNFSILKKWYDEKNKHCTSEQPIIGDESRTAAFFVWLTFALGLRLWEMRGRVIPGLPSHEYYFQAALQYFDHVASNTTTIQALLFLAMYSFRSPKGLSTWHLTGLAMRTALELGLHRKTPKALQLSPFHEENKKRIWWSVYALERTMAFQLGRPIAIQDDEIDNELPLDIDCHITDDEEIVARRVAIDKKLSETGTTLESNPYMVPTSSMAPSLHHIRLRRILTKIKGKVYHPRFSQENMEQRCANVDALALELDQWRANIPAKNLMNEDAVSVFGLNLAAQNNLQSDTQSGWDLGGGPFHACEWLELQYLNAVQSLLIPLALTAPPGSPYLHRAAHAAMAACALQRKRLQKNSMAPLAVYSLHKLFMSGVFMLFALEKDPSLSLAPENLCPHDSMKHCGFQEHGSQESKVSSEKHSAFPNGISPMVFLQVKNCQEALTIYALHYPQAKPYAQCFENMSNIWLRRFDRRDTRRELLSPQHLSPERTSNDVSDRNPAFIHRDMDHFHQPSLPPTLWKDDLDHHGRMRSSIEGTTPLSCPTINVFQPGSPYHLLSLGPVERNCEPFQLLESEEERHQLHKPRMLDHIERVCPTDFLSQTSMSPDNPGSLLLADLLGNDIQQVPSSTLLENQASRSDYSSWNDVSSDQNLSTSSNPSRELPLKTARNYSIESAVSLISNNHEYSTKLPEDAAKNFQNQPFDMCQNPFLGEGMASNVDSSVSSLTIPEAPNNGYTSELAGNPSPISDAPGSRFAVDLYNRSQINERSSSAWSGTATVECAGKASDLASTGENQVPCLDLDNYQPSGAHGNDNEFASLSLFLSEDPVQTKCLEPTPPGSSSDSCAQQDLQSCIELLLYGPGDYNRLVTNSHIQLPENSIPHGKGTSGGVMEKENSKVSQGIQTIDPSFLPGPLDSYSYNL
ncbi:hypothetical protein PCANC_13675 [Puccinia coronata f. sp. avenae]|uniref:Zn(2)-C6 fungal-type domain-containing protein n=1 Tax=Puccinia coronata f. sp. avenae TaxID=200324 RepID=A0A2N5UKV1_9BASI|nr:hypothetical protein PCANC_13675 [Puccinia coronata f. sp. avenae]